MSRQWDALVIGAGPAGLRAASVIAESGLEVVLVDEQAFPAFRRGIPAGNDGLVLGTGSHPGLPW